MNKMEKITRMNIEDGKSLTVADHTVIEKHPLHWHSFFEIEIITSGRGKYVINDVEYDIEKENVFLLTSTDFHYLKVGGVAKIINISFDETMIFDKDMAHLLFSEVKRAYSFSGSEYERIVSASRILEHECEIGGECQKTLLQYVIKSLLRKNSALTNESVSEEYFRGIKRAIVYMELHFREKINLDTVAAEAGYTPSYFSKLFKRVTGESYISMLTKYRLSYSLTLLRGGFSVVDSAFASGFGSLSGFHEAFKKKYKISPDEYKKSLSLR